MSRVFISYKRDVVPDHPLADALFAALRGQHEVFIDQRIQVGEEWARRIKAELTAADFLILLISARSIESQMVVEEVRIAEAARKAGGRPRLLPVRVAYEGDLPYDLGAVLKPIQYLLWKSDVDTPVVAQQLLAAMAGQAMQASVIENIAPLAEDIPFPSANPRALLEAPEGTMSAESPFYVRRAADAIVEDEQAHAGYTLTIKGPRQMGKSSLLGRVAARARDAGKQVAFVDFQAFGSDALSNSESLFRQFCYLIEDALDLESKLEAHWSAPLSAPQKCRRFMEKRILPACPKGMLLAIDEADNLLESPARSDFFGMLRSWHNERALKPAWKTFALAMAISTEPGMLIESLSQSPFNVGINVQLEDFAPSELANLNRGHGSPLGAAQLGELQALLAGHPYLTRKALYLVCKGRYTFANLLAEATSENGPFGDHLRALLTRLQQRPGLAAELRSALMNDRCDTAARHRLIAGGLLKEEAGRLLARNALYAQYFQKALRG